MHRLHRADDTTESKELHDGGEVNRFDSSPGQADKNANWRFRKLLFMIL